MDLTTCEEGSSQPALDRVSAPSSLIWLWMILAGLMVPLGFAPFHLPGAAILGVALFYYQIRDVRPQKAFFQGLVWGIGLFGLGVSWVSVSIHHFGHIALLYAYGITAILVVYLSLFPAVCAFIFRLLCPNVSHSRQRSGVTHCKQMLLFASLWCITEYTRANLMTGFPWLLFGFGQIDTPLQYLLPIIGVYGIGFLSILAACCLSQLIQTRKTSAMARTAWLLGVVMIMICPESLKGITWSQLDKQPLSVAVIQANISMRDKWDERLFWKIIKHYHQAVLPLLNKKDLIVLPESAIPIPAGYVQDFLIELDQQAKKNKVAILYGIPEEIYSENKGFYNTLSTLGQAKGSYRKQHLVPFGEYLPSFLARVLRPLHLVMSDMQPGQTQQPLPSTHHHPFASLVCYELAYPNLLRAQVSQAQWIVSLSDDGWFGRSFASYQHVQMAQALSMLTSRYQILANNDGLSSIITPQGKLQVSLPAFSSGILDGYLYPAQGINPWVKWGDTPVLSLCALIGVFAIAAKIKKTRAC